MSDDTRPTCRTIRPSSPYAGGMGSRHDARSRPAAQKPGLIKERGWRGASETPLKSSMWRCKRAAAVSPDSPLFLPASPFAYRSGLLRT